MRYPAKLLKTILTAGMSLFLLPVLVTPAAGQTWIELAPTGPPPPDPVFVPKHAFYDATTNRLIAFFPGHPPYNPDPPGNGNEVWILTNANGLGGTPTWVQLQPTGAPPISNGLESVVYDAANNRLIVYGGCYANCSPALSQVFVLSNANGLGGIPVWTQTSVTNPQPRDGHTAVYDPINNLMIAFGGNLAFFGTDHNDTRLLTSANAGPSTWITLSTSGGLPPVRMFHTAIYDQATNRMVIYAGHNYQKNYCCGFPYGNMVDAYGDLWVLTHANGVGGPPSWVQQTPSGPTPASRGGHSAVYDSANNRMVVFGGTSVVDFTAQTFTTLGDLWELSNANGLGGPPTWTELAQFGTPPGPRVYHAAAFDSANQRMILLGGRNDADTPPTSNRVWVLTPPNQPPVANAGPDQTVECTTHSGASVTLDGSGSSDPDSDPLTYTWTGPFPEGSGTATGVSPTVTLSQGGPYTITLTVDDGNGATDSDTVDVTVDDTAPPTLTLVNPSVTVVLPTASATGAVVDVMAESGASATDLCDPFPLITHNGLSAFPVGLTDVTITAKDACLNHTQASFTVHVIYNFIGFLPPIRNDSSSRFKAGRTIPVKFQLTAADGSYVTDASPTLEVYYVTGEVLGTVDVESSGESNEDNNFRYDPESDQYIYNLSTKGFSTGTYLLRVSLNDQTTHEVQVSIR